MGIQKGRCVMNIVVIMVDSIHKAWKLKKIVEVLYMDIKEAFDYVSRFKLAQ